MGVLLKRLPAPQVTNYSSPSSAGDGSPEPPDKPTPSVSSYTFLSIPLISSTAEFRVQAKLDSETLCPGIPYFKDLLSLSSLSLPPKASRQAGEDFVRGS